MQGGFTLFCVYEFLKILFSAFQHEAIAGKPFFFKSRFNIVYFFTVYADAALFYCPAGFGAGGGQGGCYEEAQNVNRAVRKIR